MENSTSGTRRLFQNYGRPYNGGGKKWIKANENCPEIMMEPAGYWFIPCDAEIRDIDGMTELDRVWAAAKQLVEDNIFVQATMPRSFHFPSNPGPNSFTTVPLYCYVENYLDIGKVIESAVELRKRVHYPFLLYMKTSHFTGDGKIERATRYVYCVDGDMYETAISGSYNIVKRCSSETVQ